jgi:uncharacterized protein (TIGR02145 family)
MSSVLKKKNGSSKFTQDEALKACPSGYKLPDQKKFEKLFASLAKRKCSKTCDDDDMCEESCVWKGASSALAAKGFNLGSGTELWVNYGCQDDVCYESKFYKIGKQDVTEGGCVNDGAGCAGNQDGSYQASVLCVKK